MSMTGVEKLEYLLSHVKKEKLTEVGYEKLLGNNQAAKRFRWSMARRLNNKDWPFERLEAQVNEWNSLPSGKFNRSELP